MSKIRLFSLLATLLSAWALAALPASAQVASGSVSAWGQLSTSQSFNSNAPIKKIAAGLYSNAILRADHSVVTWGYGAGQSAAMPALGPDVQEVATGGLHYLALLKNGTVRAWGDTQSGALNVPTGLTNVVSVAAGQVHSVALRSDGSVVAWGRNLKGVTNVPAGLSSVTQIATHGYHSLALTADGTVTAWGQNTLGESTVPAGLSHVRSIDAGGTFSIALKSDGTVVTWGDPLTAVPPGLDHVTAIAAGWSHAMALKDDGTVVAWGANDDGETIVPVGLSNVIAISAGGFHSLALRADGSLVAWGFNRFGQASLPDDFASVRQLSAGIYHVLGARADGTVSAWGDNVYGETQVPQGLTDVIQVSASGFHSLALKSNGTIVGWGENAYGQSSIPTDLGQVTQIAAGELHSLALRADGTVAAWGDNELGECDVPGDLRDVVSIAAGRYHSVALRSDGTVAAWGANQLGQTNVPADLTSVRAISCGRYHTLALKTDGTVVAWGDNSDHQLQIPNELRNVIAIAAGGRHSTALTADGNVQTWGANDYGQQVLPNLHGAGDIASGYQFNVAIAEMTATSEPWQIAPGNKTTVTLWLPRVLSTNADVALSASSTELRLPAKVRLPAGAKSVSFDVFTTRDFSGTALITANYKDFEAQTSVTSAPVVARLTLRPAVASAGDDVAADVELSDSTLSATTITLQSDNPAATVPDLIVVPANQTHASFTIHTANVGVRTTATIRAITGAVIRSAKLVIHPARNQTLDLAPSTVWGGQQSVATVTLDGPAPAAGVTVALSSDSPTANVPDSVIVPGGEVSATFSVTSKAVATQTRAKITTTVEGVSVSATLSILPAELASISIRESTFKGGNITLGTVTLTGLAPARGLYIDLSSSQGAVAVPLVVFVAEGHSSAKFLITTMQVTAPTSATITARFGSKTQQATITVNPYALQAFTGPTTLIGGAVGQAFIQIDEMAPIGGVVVGLTSSDNSLAARQSITIPPGRRKAAVNLRSHLVKRDTVVIVTATVGNVSRSFALTVKK